MTISQTFGQFVQDMSPPAKAIDAARLCLGDWTGAAIAGSGEMPATALRKLAPKDGTSRLIPDGTPTDARSAALINGTASHIVEVDDIFRSGLYHPGVVTIPAALAVGQMTGASVGALLDGIVAGYEVSNRIAQAVNPAHYQNWHTTGTVGHFGATAAAARVLGLDAGQTAHALGTAATFAAGLRHAFSSDAMSKPLHAGRAAEAGVLAALAAREGVTGVPDMFENGFGPAMSGPVDWDGAVADLGQDWTITRTTFKAHACCGHNFAALDGIQCLCTEHGLAADQIETVDIHTYRAALDICGNRAPVSAAEGRFSMPWCAAVMLHQGAVTPQAFTPAAMSNTAIQASMAKVQMNLDQAAEQAFPNARSARVSLILTDGTTLSHHRPTRRGDPDDPLSANDLRDKFRLLASPIIGKAPASELWAEIQHLPVTAPIEHLQSTAPKD